MTSWLTRAAAFVSSLAGVACLTLAGGPTAALAAECGDDAGGARVACSCGDIVVSDTTLRAEDPVARRRCDHDGLALRAPRGASSIQLDLAGLSLVGSGSGAGIRIMDGGDEGAVIIGGEPGRPGEIAGFRNGVRATGSRPVAEIRDLDIKGSSSDGLVLRGFEARLIRVSSDDNARDGLRVTARGGAGEASAADDVRGAVTAPAAGTAAKAEGKPR